VSQITITRDNWGIGHAVASHAAGAFWAQGWMAAEDRIWQMEYDRRRAFGRWAEVAGAGAVREDVFFRRLNLAHYAKSHWQELQPETQEMTVHYVAGVNAWLEANENNLPAEFAYHPGPPEQWLPWHCLAVYKVRHFFMGTFNRKLWRALVAGTAGVDMLRAVQPEFDPASAIVPPNAGDYAGRATPEAAAPVAPTALTDDELVVINEAAALLNPLMDDEGGSNSWAVHGSKTATGKPLLAGDPHRGIEFPNVYHQCHIACDEFDTIGLAFPGVPGFAHFGHNEHVAWCITHGMADDTDVFIEHGPFSPDRHETVAVAGGESLTVGCSATERGPVVIEHPESGVGLSLQWTGVVGLDTTFDALRPMLRAASAGEFEEAVEPWVIPVNSLLVADVEGDIVFRVRGRVVERPTPNRWLPVPGRDEFDWRATEPVPFASLPRWANPDRGFLVTANNFIAPDGPYISMDFVGPERHNRIVQLLTGRSGLTVADMAAIHTDVVSLLAPQILEILAPATPATELGRQAHELLTDWDGALDAESAAAVVYSVVRRLWAEEVTRRLGLTGGEVGEPGWPAQDMRSRQAFDGANRLLVSGQWKAISGLDDHDDLHQLLGQLIDDTAVHLAQVFGGAPDGAPLSGDSGASSNQPQPWTWGAVHQMVSPHPLATQVSAAQDLHPPVDGVGGDRETVRAAPISMHHGDRMGSGSVARYAFDLARWDDSQWVVCHGVSGVRGSGHDLDQRSNWVAGTMIPMVYSAQAVADHATSVSTHTYAPLGDE